MSGAFLYIFGYETPEQILNNKRRGWDDEDSAALFIEAPSENEALLWGQKVATAFVTLLHGGVEGQWSPANYANWIEPDPSQRFDEKQLGGLPRVGCGEFPNWTELAGRPVEE